MYIYLYIYLGMHFYLIKNPITYQYYISISNIEHVFQFKDLGIIFDSKSNFSFRTDIVKNKSIRNLGFTNRDYGLLWILFP